MCHYGVCKGLVFCFYLCIGLWVCHYVMPFLIKLDVSFVLYLCYYLMLFDVSNVLICV